MRLLFTLTFELILYNCTEWLYRAQVIEPKCVKFSPIFKTYKYIVVALNVSQVTINMFWFFILFPCWTLLVFAIWTDAATTFYLLLLPVEEIFLIEMAFRKLENSQSSYQHKNKFPLVQLFAQASVNSRTSGRCN